MKLIDSRKTRVRTEVTEHGNKIKHRDHFDGSVDAKVYLKALRIRMVADDGKPLVREQVMAIGAFEEANRHYLIAKHSGNDEWRTHALRLLKAAERRVEETQ